MVTHCVPVLAGLAHGVQVLAIPAREGEAPTFLSVPESTAHFYPPNASKLRDRVLSIEAKRAGSYYFYNKITRM